MNQQAAYVLEQIRGAWRFRWEGFSVACGVMLLGMLAILFLPDTFESRTRVYVDTESVLQPLLQGIAVERGADAQIRMMSSVLRSRPTLEKVAISTGLDRRVRNRTEREQLLKSMADKIALENTRNTNTFTISYQDSSAADAHAVVSGLLDVFMNDTVGVRRSDSGMASKFLQQQIDEYERRLTEAESRLAEFKKKNLGLMPGQSGDYFTRLQALMTSVENLQSRSRQLESRRSELGRQLSGERPTYASGSNNTTSAIDQQILQAASKLEELLSRYTDKHPEVVALREQIVRLQDDQQREQSRGNGSMVITTSGADGKAVSVLNVNPVYQNIRMSMAQTDAEIAEVRGQLADQQRQVSELQAKVNVVPDVEARLAQLNRDYEVNRAQHAALLQRLEQARISGEASNDTGQSKFQIIEPAVQSLVPVAPKRSLLLLATLVASLGAGVAAALGLSHLRPAYFSAGALAAATGKRVMGTVSLVDFEMRPWMQRAMPRFAAAAATLLLFFVLGAYAIGAWGRTVRMLIGESS